MNIEGANPQYDPLDENSRKITISIEGLEQRHWGSLLLQGL
jgi:hypothetical protein